MNVTRFILLLFCITFSLEAKSDKYDSHVERLSLAASIGYLSGESKEYVYDDFSGAKISQLNWKIRPVPVLRGEINYALFNWLDLNAQGWSTFTQGRGEMDDFDWLNPNQTRWTDWSHHKNTFLRQSNAFDFNVRSWVFQNTSFMLAGIAGYQQTFFNFDAKGGSYFYNNGEDKGYFPTVKVIGYKQNFKSPYVGLTGKYTFDSFEFKGVFKYSAWVNASDVDHHFLRDISFREDGEHFEYYNYLINAGYFIKPTIKLFMEGSLSYYPKNFASTEMIDNCTGYRDHLPKGSAGLDNRNYIIALGVQYRGN